MNTRLVRAASWWGGLMLVVGVSGVVRAQEEETTAAGEVASTATPASTPDASAPPAEAEVAPEQSAEAEAPAPSHEIAAEPTGLVSVDFKDADIRQVLRVISLKSGVDIVAGASVDGLVTIKLTNVPWEQALDIILRTYGFTYEKKNNIVRVMTVDALEQEALDTQVFPLDYAKAKEVPDVIKEILSERGKVKFDERTNTVIVTDVPTSLFQIAEVIQRLDQRTPQVLIESRIVETKLEKDENLGIRWVDSYALTQSAQSYPSTFPFKVDTTFGSFGNLFISPPVAKLTGPSALLTSNPATTLGSIGIGTLSNTGMTMTLNALKQRSDTKVVSNPTLTVLNNQQAKIHIGEDFPIPNFSIDPSTGKTTVSGFQTKTIGTILTVTPHVNPSREIVVDLKPEIISALSNVTFAIGSGSSESVSLPRFSTQTVQTQVRISDGQTIAIGGLVKDIKVEQANKVPVLGDLPLIGKLFTNTHKFGGGSNPTLQQDLLIFLTVSLTKEAPPQQAVASAPSGEAP